MRWWNNQERRRRRCERTMLILRASKHISLAQIVVEVCAKYGVTQSLLMSHRRDPGLCKARWEAWKRARDETRHSFPTIGRYFDRDHSSIIHGISKYQERFGTP